MFSWLLQVINISVASDLIDPDNIPAGYGSGIDIDMESFWLGFFVAITLSAIIIGIISFIKRDLCNNTKDEDENENNSDSED